MSRYQDVVCAVSCSSTGDRSLGEDIAQHMFVAAWTQLDRVREPGRIRPWLCGIARNLGRKARREDHLEDADAHAAASASAFDALARAASGSDAPTALAAASLATASAPKIGHYGIGAPHLPTLAAARTCRTRRRTG